MDLQTDRKGNPILDQLSEEGFVDLTFRIHDLATDRQHYRLQLKASYERRIVGMSVEVVKGIQGGFNSRMNLVKKHIYREGVRFLRSGSESDHLIAVLAKLYRSRRSVKKMVNEETYTAIALHQGPLNMRREVVNLKLFGQDSEPIDEKVYYECFFNIDMANGLVFWKEKDNDYRKSLLRALSAREGIHPRSAPKTPRRG